LVDLKDLLLVELSADLKEYLMAEELVSKSAAQLDGSMVAEWVRKWAAG